MLGMSLDSLGFRAMFRDSVNFQRFSVYLGEGRGGDLSENFDENYLDGKVPVYHGSPARFDASRGWAVIPLESPLLLRGDRDLVIEIVYHLADRGQIYCGNSQVSGNRTLFSVDPESPAGTLQPFAPHLRLWGTPESLQRMFPSRI